MNVNSEISEWIRLADMDLATAHHMFDTYHPKPLEIVCFHSQQAAEKILKCYLVSKGIEYPKIHDMQVLIEMCIEFDDEFNNIYVEATTLTNYAVSLRYPTELGIEESDTIKAIENSDKVMKFVREKLNINDDMLRKEIEAKRVLQNLITTSEPDPTFNRPTDGN